MCPADRRRAHIALFAVDDDQSGLPLARILEAQNCPLVAVKNDTPSAGLIVRSVNHNTVRKDGIETPYHLMRPSRESRNHSQARAIGAGVRAVERAFRILEVVADRAVGVSELARLTGIHKATTYRLLSTLTTLGYVERTADDATYQIGLRVARLRDTAHSRADLRKAARPALEGLGEATRLTVHLAIRSQDEVVVVDKINPPTSIQMASFVGARNPLHCTALGKSVLSALPLDELQAVLDRVRLFPKTANTITSRERLFANLDQIRAAGFAVDDVENEDGIRCVAAAIFDDAGRVLGACSVTGAVSQIPLSRVRELGGLVKNAADRVSVALGYDRETRKAMP